MKYKTFFQIKTIIYQVAALGLYLFFALSLLSFYPADPSNKIIWPNALTAHNWCGERGAWVALQFYTIFGYGVYLMILVAGYHLLRFLFCFHSKLYPVRFTGYCILQIAVCAFIALSFCNNLPEPNRLYDNNCFSERFSTNLIYGHGGIVGMFWASLFALPGTIPAFFLTILFGGIGFFLYSDFIVPFLLRQSTRFFSRKTLRWILLRFRWIVEYRTGWQREFHHPFRLGKPSFLAQTSLEPGVVYNDVDGDLPNTEGLDAASSEKSNENMENTEKVVIHIDDPDVNSLFSSNDGDAQTRSDGSNGNDGSNSGTEVVSTPKKRVCEEAVDGYEIDENTQAPRKLRGANSNSGKNTSTEKEDKKSGGISIHHPDSAPINLSDVNALDGVSSSAVSTSSAASTSSAEPNASSSLTKGEDETDEPLNELPAEEEPEYVFPSLDLLEQAAKINYSEFETGARERASQLETIVQEFGFKVFVREIQLGPTITQYQVEPEQGLRVAKIASLADDLAVKLGVSNVRIVFPLLGKQNLIGIEIPNNKKQLVRLREVMEQLEGTYDKMNVPMFLGKDVAGKPLMADLTTLPHLLIAGQTGTGKSVCLNSIITSIIMTRSPQDVRMLMIDPKSVEMCQYQTIPHLMHPIVTDMKKAEAILAWAVEKMESRYQWFARAGVKHVTVFNQLSHEQKLKRVKPKSGETMPETMPFIIIIVDEMADLMMTAPKEVESHIIRLAQKSRAAGIHLILATQKPIVSVITTLIKSNLPSRIAFKVSSKTDSRVVLDENGADRLLGHGDMLFLLPGTNSLIRAQGTYLSDDEINRVVESISTYPPTFDAAISEAVNGGGSGKMEEWAAKDELYTSAIEIIVNERRGSITLLQRMLGIGYGRAARLIDYMEEDHIVGAFSGYTKPREVLLSKDDWNAMKAEFEKQQEASIQAQVAEAKSVRLAAKDEALDEDLDEDLNDEEDDFDLNDEENLDDEEDDFDPDDEENLDDEEDDFDPDDEENLNDEEDEFDPGNKKGLNDKKDLNDEEDDLSDEGKLPWDEGEADDQTDGSTTSMYPRPPRVFERSQGKSRRRKTPNYDKLRQKSGTLTPPDQDLVNTPESRQVLNRIEPNQPDPFLQDGNQNYRKIH